LLLHHSDRDIYQLVLVNWELGSGQGITGRTDWENIALSEA
jgi:hypothetical protein